jgi:hypothetical protein
VAKHLHTYLHLIGGYNRTHRERKEAYTKSLEQEVIQLRANEAKILQETRKLYTELTAMKQLMASHGIQVPASFAQNYDIGPTSASSTEEEVFDLSIRITNTKQKRRQICVYKPSGHQSSQQYDRSTTTHSEWPSSASGSVSQSTNRTSMYTSTQHMLFKLTKQPAFLSPLTSDDLAIHTGTGQRVNELDLTTIGMDFVLT